MQRIYIQLLIIIWTVISLLSPDIVMAQSRNNIDVALVMDSSGSMKKTDPKSLRIPAAQLFISLLDSNDRAAVLSFSDQAYPITGLTPVDNETNKKKLLNATEKITSKGLHTNLYGAFNKGMELLLDAKQEGREQIIVLMSDGMMDVGDHEKDRQLLAHLKSELSGVLKENNIKVYAIAFTDQSDRRLLEKLSKQTGGFYNLALSDKDFHLIFTSIFESLKSPEMLPMEKNGFLIDGSIQEVTIVVSKESAATDIQINAPDGQTYAGNKQYSGISWFISENFDMITVQKPVDGRWEILYSTGENNKAYIITDLKLETNFEKLYAVFGENLDVKAWLEKEGDIIRVGEVLETTDIYLELNNPDGNRSKLKPLNSGDGIFQKSITLFKDGNYKLRVVAKGKTYEREKAFLFNVANLQESKEDLKAAREAWKDEQSEAQENAVEEEQDPVNWARIIMHFIIINLVIGFIVIAYMKRQSIKDLKLIVKFFNRSKDTSTSQAKEKETEDNDTEIESTTGESAEKQAGEAVQVQKTLVKLEDAESEGNEAEQHDEKGNKEPEKEGVAIQEAASEEDDSDDTGNDDALNNLEEEIQRLEQLKQKAEETQAVESTQDTASETEESKVRNESEKGQGTLDTDVQEAVKAEENVEPKQESDGEQQKTDEQAPQLEEVKESSVPQSEVKGDVETDTEEKAQTEAIDAEESVDDMWADAMKEQEAEGKSGEEKSESAVETHRTEDLIPLPEIKEMQEPANEAKKQVNADMNEVTEQSENEEAERVVEEHELHEDTHSAKANEPAETKTEEQEATVLRPEETEPDPDESDKGEIDDMWTAALNDQANVSVSIEKTASTNIEYAQEDTGLAEDHSEKDADQIWAEALSEHEDTEASEKKVSDNKNNQEGLPGASS